MIVKIGDLIANSEDQPVMVVLSDQDKENIANMLPECHKYCSFPENRKESEIRDFMKLL